jgi:hypothetical protein
MLLWSSAPNLHRPGPFEGFAGNSPDDAHKEQRAQTPQTEPRRNIQDPLWIVKEGAWQDLNHGGQPGRLILKLKTIGAQM